jgi:hypothetical protein
LALTIVAPWHPELTGFQLWDAACDEGERAAKQVMGIG